MKNKEIELEEILEELENKLLIVEGKRDEKALKSLGLKHIIAINGRPLYQVVELVIKRKKEVVILTDFDKKGREINRKLAYMLQKRGKPPNSKLRCKVMSLEKNKIEDFGANSKNITLKEDDHYVKTRTSFNKICYKGRNRGTRSNRKT
jgi:5S rRNA maturation endonuclease (ribonuclease M5)